MGSVKDSVKPAPRAAKPRAGSVPRVRTAKEQITRPARTPRANRPDRPRVSVPGPAVLYDASLEPDVVDVAPRTVLAIEGAGLPTGEVGPFQDAIGALYGVAYALKFGRKATGSGDFAIGCVEACWWADSDLPLDQVPPADWRWTLRLAMPDDVSDDEVARAVAEATSKGRKLAGSTMARSVTRALMPAMRMGRLLHRGPYDQMGPSVDKLRARLAESQLTPTMRHSEVYLNDPRKAEPENIKTVILLECN